MCCSVCVLQHGWAPGCTVQLRLQAPWEQNPQYQTTKRGDSLGGGAPLGCGVPACGSHTLLSGPSDCTCRLTPRRPAAVAQAYRGIAVNSGCSLWAAVAFTPPTAYTFLHTLLYVPSTMYVHTCCCSVARCGLLPAGCTKAAPVCVVCMPAAHKASPLLGCVLCVVCGSLLSDSA